MKLDGISQLHTPPASAKTNTNKNEDFAAVMAASMAQPERMTAFNPPSKPLESRSTPLSGRPNGGVVFGGEGPLKAGTNLSAYQNHLQKAVELEKKLGTDIPVLAVEDTGTGSQRLRESEQSASELITNTMLLMQMLNENGNYKAMVAKYEGPKQDGGMAAAPAAPLA